MKVINSLFDVCCNYVPLRSAYKVHSRDVSCTESL